MIQFQTLRLSGFKSFVDRTELDIRPGLNGIVGPNGCGKSNVVEALRWVMGENSAKRMRGDGMEDVIFAGTSARSARNIAEVSILLNNSQRVAPAAFNGSDEIEIVRRIERDRGSSYKINGKNVRARDVQMLFADTVTGANSPALVSQGHITKIINSKPLERRLILEESAGITGLFARRHEAELRLKAADTNLQRLDDLMGGMDERLKALKRQARQASRYRNINAQIRQLELAIAYMEWLTLEERERNIKAKFEEAETTATEKMQTVAQLTKTQNQQAQDLPALRKEEAEFAAALQNKKLNLQRIQDEAERLERDIADTSEQLSQTQEDQDREEETARDNEKHLAALQEEEKSLLAREEKAEDTIQQKQDIRDDLETKVTELEERYNALLESTAQSRAEKESLAAQGAQSRARIEKIEARHEITSQNLEQKQKDAAGEQGFEALDDKLTALEKQQASDESTLKEKKETRAALSDTIESNRNALHQAEQGVGRLTSEIEALSAILDKGAQENFTPVLDQLSIESGFEKALSRALGDSLMASLDDDAPSQWLTRGAVQNLPSLPEGCQAMTDIVEGPKELALSLSQIGYIENEQDARVLIDQLHPGQAIVSAGGSYWRWDGFYVSESAKDPFTLTLEQKNKLAALADKRPTLEKEVASAQAALDQTTQQRAELDRNIEALENIIAKRAKEMQFVRQDYTETKERRARLETEIQNLQATLSQLKDEEKEERQTLTSLEAKLDAANSANEEEHEARLNDVKQSLLETRETYHEAVRAFENLKQEKNTRKARLQALSDERVTIKNRTIRAKEHLKQLKERHTALKVKLEQLHAQPTNFEDAQEELLSTISQLEEQRGVAAEKLNLCENAVAETGRALREAESALSEAREARAGAQATLAGFTERRETMEREAQEAFDMPLRELQNHLTIEIEGQELNTLREKKEKITRERDNIGAVNLRAEDEAVELEKEVGTMLEERQDLMDAIEELRTGISTINREARERLLAAFTSVNAHFKTLFTRLFGGGQAHLELLDSDDPLDAGLEIFAQPPGKSLQSLSLLSGGEQTMASIALIIAMFLTNPSPICVLDEIDAPLDDTNVDRVCDLLEEIAERGETRFLIITHHRLTMARMDYLYGVTMPEKGVSQLVSVDLQQSFDFVEAA